MKVFFDILNTMEKKIYDLKQVERYLDKVEGLKRDRSNNVSSIADQYDVTRR